MPVGPVARPPCLVPTPAPGTLTRCARFAALAIAASFATAACGPERTGGIGGARRAFSAGDFEQALAESRSAAARSSGDARDRARYLEGLALLRLGRPAQAVEPLRDATDSADRALAADACVSLGTAHARCDNFNEAGQAYRRAALLLDGDESRRAHSIAARCFDRAGLLRAAEEERAAAGEPRIAAAPEPQPTARGGSTDASSSATEPKTTTERTVNGMAIEPIRYAIQAGAFSDRARAKQVADALAATPAAKSMGSPRIVEKERAGATTVFVVQIGAFPNRAVAGREMLRLPRAGYTVERAIE